MVTGLASPSSWGTLPTTTDRGRAPRLLSALLGGRGTKTLAPGPSGGSGKPPLPSASALAASSRGSSGGPTSYGHHDVWPPLWFMHLCVHGARRTEK